MRYETQEGFGLSFGPIAATVWIVRLTERADWDAGVKLAGPLVAQPPM